MNSKRGFKRITFALAAVAALSGTVIGVSIVINEYENAKGFLRWKRENLVLNYGNIFDRLVFERTGKTAGTVLDIGRFRRKFPMYDDMSDTELIQKLNRKYSQDEAEVRELERGFWIQLYKPSLVAFCEAGGLVGAFIGFSSAWLILWFDGLAIYKISI